ncbi:MAG: flagellar basal body L-ring protein FlgH [Verrucomicrobiota bacterium]
MRKRSWSPSRRVLLALLCSSLAGAASAQSLWKESTSTSMVSDKRAHAVGDILTIVVQESNTASKDNSTKTAKSSGVDASISSFFYAPTASGLLTKNGQLPALKLSGKQDFSGGGQINNSERITARIAVKVVDILPNGNLVIEGTRQTSFAGETQDAVLRGVVRSEDVQSNNTVFSYNVADATIRYVSKGSVSDSQRKGWFTRILDKLTPF